MLIICTLFYYNRYGSVFYYNNIIAYNIFFFLWHICLLLLTYTYTFKLICKMFCEYPIDTQLEVLMLFFIFSKVNIMVKQNVQGTAHWSVNLWADRLTCAEETFDLVGFERILKHLEIIFNGRPIKWTNI